MPDRDMEAGLSDNRTGSRGSGCFSIVIASEAKQSSPDSLRTPNWITSELTLLAMTERVQSGHSPIVMAGLDPAIHVLLRSRRRRGCAGQARA
jgi:hypothetical protein